MKARRMFVDARGTMSFVDYLGYRRIIRVDCERTIAIDAMFLTRTVAGGPATMKRYIAIRHIASASGTQFFEVEANSKEEAFAKFENGDGNFVEEEIEVESLDELTMDDVHEEDQPQ